MFGTLILALISCFVIVLLVVTLGATFVTGLEARLKRPIKFIGQPLWWVRSVLFIMLLSVSIFVWTNTGLKYTDEDRVTDPAEDGSYVLINPLENSILQLGYMYQGLLQTFVMMGRVLPTPVNLVPSLVNDTSTEEFSNTTTSTATLMVTSTNTPTATLTMTSTTTVTDTWTPSPTFTATYTPCTLLISGEHGANVRSSPGTGEHNLVIIGLPNGTQLKADARSEITVGLGMGRWYHVVENGGWIFSEMVSVFGDCDGLPEYDENLVLVASPTLSPTEPTSISLAPTGTPEPLAPTNTPRPVESTQMPEPTNTPIVVDRPVEMISTEPSIADDPKGDATPEVVNDENKIVTPTPTATPTQSSVDTIMVEIVQPAPGAVISNASQMVAEVRAWDSAVGTENGAGITQVNMKWLDSAGNHIITDNWSISRQIPYCWLIENGICAAVSVEAFNALPDGTYELWVSAYANGLESEWVIREVTILHDDLVILSTVFPTETATPAPTETIAVPTATVEPSATPTVTEEPTSTPVPTEAPSVTPQPTATLIPPRDVPVEVTAEPEKPPVDQPPGDVSKHDRVEVESTAEAVSE